MRCHYTYTEEGEKVLIPECWPVVASGDIRDCICKDKITWEKFEKERYNKILAEMQEEIHTLQQENEYLTKLVEKLTKKKIHD